MTTPHETDRERLLQEGVGALRSKLLTIRQGVEARCDGCPHLDLGCNSECEFYPVRKLVLEAK